MSGTNGNSKPHQIDRTSPGWPGQPRQATRLVLTPRDGFQVLDKALAGDSFMGMFLEDAPKQIASHQKQIVALVSMQNPIHSFAPDVSDVRGPLFCNPAGAKPLINQFFVLPLCFGHEHARVGSY